MIGMFCVDIRMTYIPKPWLAPFTKELRKYIM